MNVLSVILMCIYLYTVYDKFDSRSIHLSFSVNIHNIHNIDNMHDKYISNFLNYSLLVDIVMIPG